MYRCKEVQFFLLYLNSIDMQILAQYHNFVLSTQDSLDKQCPRDHKAPMDPHPIR